MNIAPCMPKPHVNVRRSRVVMARSAAMVSSSGPSGPAQHPPVRQLRQPPVHRLVQPEQAVLGQAQHHRRGDRLGDRGDPEQRAGLHRRPPGAITPAAAMCVSSPRPTAATTPGASPWATAVSTISSSLSPSVISSAYDRAVTLSGSP
jgi:hypothetical protein